MEAIRTAWIELTNECQLSCSHCYNDSGPGKGSNDRLTLDDYKEALCHLASDRHCQSVQFIGGEPLSSPKLPDLLEYAHLVGIPSIQIYSNLYSIPSRVRKMIVDYKIDVLTSIYSAIPYVHDAITQRPGSHRRLLESAASLRGAGVCVRAGFVEMDCNQGHLEAARHLLAEFGIEVGYDKVRDFGRASRGTCELGNLCGHCGSERVCIGFDGIVAPCIMSKPWAIGNLHNVSLKEILDSPRLEAFREMLRTRDHPATRPGEIRACHPVLCSPDQCWPNTECNPGKCAPSYNPCNPYQQCLPSKWVEPDSPVAKVSIRRSQTSEASK